MKIRKKLFTLKRSEPDCRNIKGEDLIRAVAKLTDSTVTQLTKTHLDRLLTQPTSYLVSAVWGTPMGMTFDAAQKDIYNRVEPLLKEIMAIVNIENLTKDQELVLGFLVRGLLISRIGYLVERYKEVNQIREKTENPEIHDLAACEPAGNA